MSLSSTEANVVDRGALIFDVKLEFVTLSHLGRRQAGLGPGAPSVQARIELNVTYKPSRGQTQYYDTTFYKGQTKKSLLGSRRFALTLTDVLEGTQTEDFVVQPAPWRPRLH